VLLERTGERFKLFRDPNPGFAHAGGELAPGDPQLIGNARVTIVQAASSDSCVQSIEAGIEGVERDELRQFPFVDRGL
jgi:hypothetical protein